MSRVARCERRLKKFDRPAAQRTIRNRQLDQLD
jgi:hypothetical protein